MKGNRLALVALGTNAFPTNESQSKLPLKTQTHPHPLRHRRVGNGAFAGFCTLAMLIPSQFLLTTATAQVREVKNVKEIRKHEMVRYYRINEFSVHKFIGGVHYSFRALGRFKQDLHMDIYFVNPILTHKKQVISMTPLYWYGVNFHKQISNLLSQREKEARFRKFLDECMAKMQHYDFYTLDHFENKPASYDLANFG
jgi:hypothetical protein